MSSNDLSRGLLLIFRSLPGRISKLEKYLESHTRTRAKTYIAESMELLLRKDKK